MIGRGGMGFRGKGPKKQPARKGASEMSNQYCHQKGTEFAGRKKGSLVQKKARQQFRPLESQRKEIIKKAGAFRGQRGV